MKPRLILHIGSHKTATTTLQYSLANSRAKLLEHGVLYPATNRPPFHRRPRHTSLQYAILAGGKKLAREWAIIEQEFRDSGAHTMVISSEGFWRAEPEVFDFFRTIAADWQLIVIASVRRQDRFAESMWAQQVCYLGCGQTLPEYIASELFQPRIRYLWQLDKWAEFADVRTLEFQAAIKLGVTRAFATAAEIPVFEAVAAKNLTDGINYTLYVSMLNRLGINKDGLRLRRLFQHDKSKYVFGRADRMAFLKQFEDENRQLKERYGVEFGTDIPDGPEHTLTLPALNAQTGQLYLNWQPGLLAKIVMFARKNWPKTKY
jgi:hypothetical protein